MTCARARDHGGGLDAARAHWGGTDWIDLSTGINPQPYCLPLLPPSSWSALPDSQAVAKLLSVARTFWNVPAAARILAAPGASALIARLPMLAPPGRVAIPGPTYNEHAAAFLHHGWEVAEEDSSARVIVHPNNPDGRLRTEAEADAPLCVIDESFCDTMPDASLVRLAARPGTVVLKSFGKFWGLAGLRLGFAIARPETLAPLAEALGPWP
ncbi:MAG: aminotransferase class I/II-fold pyridoxal phosphate-dependent enzyme, partial [Jannaschia sp.]